ncbi:MerR family transcriptional regulator [Marinactinospora rubrisoli]|uniref:MerR family transcriptional regulator n=1 Tax=Marinactinospora rubrisoli TaxID=2715399 RepID=A0ABW2KGT0_9ACTN
MTQNTMSIGDLAARAGLTVKTVRYYTDIGLLPTAGRSSGGHRRYGPEALERLRLVQRLRALDTPIAAIAEVVTGERSLDELVSVELGLVERRLSELRWRQATLEALSDCVPEERLRRLELLARVQRLPEAHTDLVRTWGRVIPRSVPGRLADLITADAVPEPPPAPSADMVLAYAELHVLAAHPEFPVYWVCPHVRDKASLYAGLVDACTAALESRVDAESPRPVQEAVDIFAAACARARGETDGPGFRTFMAAALKDVIPLFRRYWGHVSVVTGDRGTNLGSVHVRLVEALAPAAAVDSLRTA